MKKPNTPPPGTPPPEPDLRDMDGFHRTAASGWLAELCTRLGGYNVVPFKPRSARPGRKRP